MKRFLFFCIFLFPLAVRSQNASDSTKSLFKTPHYSWIQWDFGYCGMTVKKQFINGFDGSLIGIVFNEKWATSIGVSGWVSKTPFSSFNGAPLKVDSYVTMYWSGEFLLHPKRLVNFSFPLKIGYTGATTWDNLPPCTGQCIANWNHTGENFYQHEGEFWTITPGANLLLNVFKPVSIGLGVNYRLALNAPKVIGTNADFSGLSFLAFIRFKYDTRAFNQKMMERQQRMQSQNQ